MPPQTFNPDHELAQFFTDVEHLRDAFKSSVAAPALTKRLLVIHGVGGVGKSSLLRMFRLHCKGAHVPVALASGDEAKSALDVLARWVDDLKADDVVFSSFGKTFERYRAIQAKVENESAKTAEKLAKGAAKTVIETAASTIPGVGPLIGKLGGMGAEALVDWLRGFLKQPDIDLLLDPTKKLSDDFLDDLAKSAEKKRIVLMLDTFEQMTALDDWARDVAQKLGAFPNAQSIREGGVLFVIAGRALPNWSRAWQGWMASAQVEELEPMTEDVMRDLVRRYYATMRGGEPNPAQVEAIIRFARGLPMVVTSAVQLWVKYGVEDFQSVKTEIVANLVDRLMEGVPNELIPALEAAAIVRWFDQPILRAVMKQDDVRDVYNEVRRFPFVRTRAEGLALHDAVREMMDENLRVQDSERHCELHERAATYFEKRLEKLTGEETERLGLERLYHRIRADEEAGTKLFQEMAEELVRYRLINRLRTLLNDVNAYALEIANSRLWRGYYSARLAHLEGRTADEKEAYQSIGEDKRAEPSLRAYALCDLGDVLSRYEGLKQPDGTEIATSTLERSLNLAPLDFHLARSFFYLARIYRYQAKWDEEIFFLDKAKAFFEQRGDGYGLAYVHIERKRGLARRGLWRDLFATQERLDDLCRCLPESAALESETLGSWAWCWALAGRLSASEQRLKASIDLSRSLDDPVSLYWVLPHLGWALGYQGRYLDAERCFSEYLEIANNLAEKGHDQEDRTFNIGYGKGFWGVVLTRQGRTDKAAECLSQSLSIGMELGDPLWMLESLTWLGRLSEVKQNLDEAQDYFDRCSNWKWYRQHFFYSESLTGLVRVKHVQGDYAAIPPLLAEAEQLAQQYEYNDHLASLRLSQGHIAWNGHIPEWGNGFEAALYFYQQALIYALRYNRFLLDEVLWGGNVCTPLRPIIPHCLERGEEGRKVLTVLRDWWKTGVNDIGTPRPDTISPIPEGIPLLEAERIAREREPGDGAPQKSVVEQIEAVLGPVTSRENDHE